jgi:N-acetylglucosaminyl-diphospho-decaprenol L-rhamnosyltransferase
MRVGVATIQRGRVEHLARQVRGVLCDQSRNPDRYVVLSMDPTPGPAERAMQRAVGPRANDVQLVSAPVEAPARLPLATARNRALRALGDVDLAILLDVDCIPGRELVARYLTAHADHPTAARLLAGPVAYLPPGLPQGVRLRPGDRAQAEPPAARPVPADGELCDEPRHELFWSLSFAVRPDLHERIGGFDERYAGYGGEDTDYALRARDAGVGLTWVGGAWAYHQHHPVSDPPREHLRDIVCNARLFRERWGRWPMEGWLRAFAAEGLVDWDPDGAVLRVRDPRAIRK